MSGPGAGTWEERVRAALEQVLVIRGGRVEGGTKVDDLIKVLAPLAPVAGKGAVALQARLMALGDMGNHGPGVIVEMLNDEGLALAAGFPLTEEQVKAFAQVPGLYGQLTITLVPRPAGEAPLKPTPPKGHVEPHG